ncbi:NfeD family protein [Oceanisphaera avium]|uniref:NfeD-like C-terminal domain-containing protein n=1 Tax=Oceanisphaera avium TaxID=1903694 RepID=A0A1Y0CVV7_9GAMM|nr:hypothetical protein [Oceanisphaera avium]ART79348.1 hypothetical protein CBP12_03625 [Oceanisphaera avium]
MLAWQAWLIAGLILLLLELFSLSFFAIAFGLAALVAMLIALLGGELIWQWLAFALSALLLAPSLKSLFRRFSPSQRRHFLAGEAKQQVGEIAQLSTGELRVKFDGDLYLICNTAKRSLKVGQQVIISRFDGITAIID